MDTNIRVAGEAGQGVQTTGMLLVHALASLGLHVISGQVYMSRIRGGLNWYDVRIADYPLYSLREKADILVALAPEAVEELSDEVAENGRILFDGKDGGDRVLAMPFTETAKEVAGSAIMANAVAAGAAFALLDYPVDKLCEFLARHFEKKGDEVVSKNIECAKRGAQLASDHAGHVEAPTHNGIQYDVLVGGDVIAMSAARSGVKFVAAYPMTPSTPVFTALASLADRYGILVEQAEDEIMAVNMICGAVYAGVPAITTTSGGGFALMTEGVSLAGMLELPIVISLGQRPGPATGLPTRTGQEDLRLAIHAGHGEFAKAVFAPGTITQAYHLTRRALQTAHKYQTPTILMTDQYLVDQERNAPALDDRYDPVDRHILADPPDDYLRYAVTESGVSPRALPGSNAFVIVDSDEHTEDGHITENLRKRVELQDKRMRKLQGMIGEFLPPEFYGPKNPEQLLICWGSTYGPVREAVDRLQEAGRNVALLHFPQVWPINVEAVRAAAANAGFDLSNSDQIVCVEGNCTAQFASLLRELNLIGPCRTMLRYDGLHFTGDQIARRVG